MEFRRFLTELKRRRVYRVAVSTPPSGLLNS
jgi:hypothetical protein